MVSGGGTATLVLGLLAGTAAAQTMAPLPPAATAARALAWEDCVAIAALQNPSLVSAQFLVQAGRAGYLGSFNGLLPTLTLSNSYATSGPAADGRASYAAGASAGVNLFNMGQVAAVRASAATYAQDQVSLRSTSAGLRFNLRQAFAQAYFAERTAKTAELILQIQRNNAERVDLRYESGKEYKGNMMSARAQVTQAQASLDGALRAVHTTRRALAQQLGVDEFSELAATGVLVAQPPADFPARMRDLVEGRPDVASQETAVRSARVSVASARAPLWPTLSASYSRTRTGLTEFPGSQYAWSAGAVLSYPLFGGGPTSTYFAAQSARRNLDKAESDLRSVRNAALVDLENAWAAYANAIDQLRSAEAQLVASRQRNDEASVRYASGLLSFDNWEVIIAEWVSAEQQAVSAQQGAVTAQAAWEKALGKGLGE